jgi:predicted DNA-binding transcriptional regulator YafY
MASPTSRLLDLLELLQSRPLTTGREIGDRLGVERRTVRRYIAALQNLGVPVEGQRGVGGGYRIRPGYRLPPLMFDGEEAVAVSLGLLAAPRLGIADDADATERALRKLHRVLPDAVRRRLEALEESISFTAAGTSGPFLGSDVALQLADAIHRRRRITMSYVSHDGRRSSRVVSPYGLVVHAGRWYLAAFDQGRDDLRSFRADRCSDVEIADGPLEDPPEGFDAVELVSRSFARVPRRWTADVVLALPFDQATARLPLTLAEVAPAGDRTRVRMRVDNLDWLAPLLAGLDCDFVVDEPEELRVAVRDFAARLRRRALASAP